jgi:hypothetical protein
MEPGFISTALKAPVHAEVKAIATRHNKPMSVIIARALKVYRESGMEAIHMNADRKATALK